MSDASQSTASQRFDATQGPRIVGPTDGKMVDFGSFGVRFLIRGEESGGGFSLIEHPIPPRTLVAPLHRHTNEDEYSYVVEGRMGAQLGGEIVYADAGNLVFKPRNQWHTFWNAGETPCRVLEIISPAGFERVFDEMAADPEALVGETAAAMDARYGIDVDYDSVARLCTEHNLSFPM
jgi:mannose-6-phosphate isomerase-like protein (cupin superfamily)